MPAGRRSMLAPLMKRPCIHLPTPEVAGHVAVAWCSVSPIAGAGAKIALAPCFFQVGAANDAGLAEIQLTPAGSFKPRDGRDLPVDAWNIDAAIAAKVIERFRANKTPLVFDYEHQTLRTEDNGQPAPAAGFIQDMVWREGVGLFAIVDLTKRAREFIANGEYRYCSPVISYDQRTGDVVSVLMGALTNNPAIDGMAPIELRAAARFSLHEETEMINKHLLALCVALAIATENQTEDQLGASALAAIKERSADPLVQLRADLGLPETVGAAEVSTAVVALKNKAANAGSPDPAKFVGVEVVNEMRTQIATLTQQNNARTVDDLVKPALEDGRLLPAQEKWARELGAKDIASLTAYLADAQPIAALSGSQTDGRAPAGGKDENGLTPAELAIAAATGVTPKDFAAAKAA